MSFKVTIEETKTVVAVSGKEWKPVDTEEVARDNQWTAKEGEPKTRIKEVFGYTPEIEKRVAVTREVYMQVVDTMNLTAVIAAINDMHV